MAKTLSRTLRAIALVAIVSSVAARTAHADDVEGYVMTIDGADVVVDLGVKQGAAVGDVVDLWRPLKLKHPVTGKIVTDRFKIGALRLTQVRDKLSLARPDGTITKAVEAGDVVVLHGVAPPTPTKPATPAPTPTAPTPPTTPPPSAAPETDPEARALSLLFDELKGASVEVRIARYESFASAWSKGRYATVLREEAAALRRTYVTAATASDDSPLKPASLSFDGPNETITGTELTIAVEIGGNLKGAIVQVRLAEETTYQPLPMTPAGPRYYRITLPAARVRAPTVSYFIEAVLADGSTSPVEGTASAPHTVKVIDAPKAVAPAKWQSTAAVWSDYADYNRLRGNDWAWQTEGYFGMRFRDVGLRAVRSGFGVFKGQGGSLKELDVERLQPRTIGLSYGYVEGEWGVTHFWGIVGRAIVGLSEDGVTGGAQGFVRIGNDKRTNMLLGGEVLGGVGLRGIAQLELNAFPRFPVMFRSEVTNQPAGTTPSYAARNDAVSSQVGAIGVRAILQAGYRPVPGFTLFVRGSYQGRTINHAGPGVGGGVSVEW